MERLTDKFGLLACEDCKMSEEDCGTCGHSALGVLTLVAYENAGLSPAEVAKLVEAKRDGRLLILPYKTGTRVLNYYMQHAQPVETKVNEYFVNDSDQLIMCLANGNGYVADYAGAVREVRPIREDAEAALAVREGDSGNG